MKSLVNLIGDFANMNRTPDFKAKTQTSPSNLPNMRRRHSLNLTVGVSDDIPPFSVRCRTNRRQSVACTSDEGIDATAAAWVKLKDKGRRRSAPCVVRSDDFHRKLAHLRQSNSLSSADEEDEEDEEKIRSRRGSKQAFMDLMIAKGSTNETKNEQRKESQCESEEQSTVQVRMRQKPISPKPSDRKYAHRASIVIIDDNDVSSIHSSALIEPSDVIEPFDVIEPSDAIEPSTVTESSNVTEPTTAIESSDVTKPSDITESSAVTESPEL